MQRGQAVSALSPRAGAEPGQRAGRAATGQERGSRGGTAGRFMEGRGGRGRLVQERMRDALTAHRRGVV